ncbi:MAG: hypothetical protein ACTSPI_05635, partial [Candidatus Heimdallarchaeaceae archaeon]
LLIIPKVEGEDERELRKKRFQILYGSRFFIWVIITSIFSFGVSSISILSVIRSQDVLIIISQFFLLLLAVGLYWFIYKQTITYKQILPTDLLLKAVDYYMEVDLKNIAYQEIEKYLELNPHEIPILSKLAMMNLRDSKYDEVLKITGRIIANVEDQELEVPHIMARAYLLRSLSFKNKEEYEKAFKAISSSLTYDPNNQLARRIRRELRTKLKAQKNEEKPKK